MYRDPAGIAAGESMMGKQRGGSNVKLRRAVVIAGLVIAGLAGSAISAGGASADPPRVRVKILGQTPSDPCLGASVDVLGATVGYRSGGAYHQIVGLGDQPANLCAGG